MPKGGQTEYERTYSHDRYYSKGSKGQRRKWTQREINAILDDGGKTDAELSVELNRSIMAIQVKRCFAKKGERV